MALSSQATTFQEIGDLTGLAHEIFAKGVKWAVLAESPTAQLFNRAQKNVEYKIQGEALVGGVQLGYANGAMASTNMLPDHQFRDAVQWSTSPVRRFRRIAQDNFVAARASGDGAFQDLGSMIFDQLWDSWSRMEIRHAVGDSRAYVCLVGARTSSTVWTAKDGHGHTGCHPLLHLEKGSVIAWLDVTSSLAPEGAGIVDSINYSTLAVTMDSASTWEPGDQVAANDPVVMATTNSISAAHFATENANAPNGVGNIVDPDDVFDTVIGINETTAGNERWKPFRETSATFDHFEVAEHWRKLKAYSTRPVGPGTHVAICQGAVSSELARTLGGYQQQQNLGRTFEGGYTAVRIAVPGSGQMEFVEDDYFYQDVLVTLDTECLYRADLGGDADFYTEDGSQWSRLQDQDAQEAYVREYMQTFCNRRNGHGALVDIALPNVDENDFAGGVPQ